MSARFFKIFSIVLLAHMVIFSVLWVGFPVPPARVAAAFIYEGAHSGSPESVNPVSDVGQNPKTSGPLYFDRFEASYFNHWIELRDISKS